MKNNYRQNQKSLKAHFLYTHLLKIFFPQQKKIPALVFANEDLDKQNYSLLQVMRTQLQYHHLLPTMAGKGFRGTHLWIFRVK